MQLAVRKITANTRDPSALIAISTRAGGGKYVCQKRRITEKDTRQWVEVYNVSFYDAALKYIKVLYVQKKNLNK